MMTTQDPMVASIEQLQQALATQGHNQEHSWKTRLRDALRAVEQALGRQPAPTDKIVQSNLELQRREISPGVTREARTLRHNQQTMFETIDRLVAELDRAPGEHHDVAALAKTGADLVKSLQEFCAAKNKLVFDNVMGDTGAGD